MLQQQMARERDTFEVVAFLRAENDTLQERLKHFEGKHVTALISQFYSMAETQLYVLLLRCCSTK